MKSSGWGEPCYCSFLSFAADVSGIDWMVRHGRSLALSVAVSVAPSRLCSPKYYNSVQEMILSNATADRVSAARAGGSPVASTSLRYQTTRIPRCNLKSLPWRSAGFIVKLHNCPDSLNSDLCGDED